MFRLFNIDSKLLTHRSYCTIRIQSSLWTDVLTFCIYTVGSKVRVLFSLWVPQYSTIGGLTPSLLEARLVSSSFWRLSSVLYHLLEENQAVNSFCIVSDFKMASSKYFDVIIPKNNVLTKERLNIGYLPIIYSVFLDHLSTHPKIIHKLFYMYSQVPKWFPVPEADPCRSFPLFFVLIRTENIATQLSINLQIDLIPRNLEETTILASRFNQSFFENLPGSKKHYGELVVKDIIKGFIYTHQLIRSKYPNPYSPLP